MLGAATPFADKALRENWGLILDRVGPARMPRPVPAATKRAKATYQEYGCGYYGCVFPTGTPGLVLKVTSDPTEVAFVTAAGQIGEWPAGIVRYYDLMAVPDGSYRGRAVYLLWREEAQHIGKWDTWNVVRGDDYLMRARQVVFTRLKEFKGLANEVRNAIVRARDRAQLLAAAQDARDWAWDFVELDDVEMRPSDWQGRGSRRLLSLQGARRVAAYRRGCEMITEMMANEAEGVELGDALGFYLEHDILLADVHANNVGEVTRDSHTRPFLAITDPGHAVFLR